MSKPTGERYTLAVDFDGVLHSYSTPWAGHGTIADPPVEGAIEWLNEIVEQIDVVIFTTRGQTTEGRLAVMDWLFDNGYTGASLLVTCEKIPALAYLDDRGLRFNGPGTFPSVNEVHQLRPWNRPVKETSPAFLTDCDTADEA